MELFIYSLQLIGLVAAVVAPVSFLMGVANDLLWGIETCNDVDDNGDVDCFWGEGPEGGLYDFQDSRVEEPESMDGDIDNDIKLDEVDNLVELVEVEVQPLAFRALLMLSSEERELLLKEVCPGAVCWEEAA